MSTSLKGKIVIWLGLDLRLKASYGAPLRPVSERRLRVDGAAFASPVESAVRFVLHPASHRLIEQRQRLGNRVL
jgi:hypothetical protein